MSFESNNEKTENEMITEIPEALRSEPNNEVVEQRPLIEMPPHFRRVEAAVAHQAVGNVVRFGEKVTLAPGEFKGDPRRVPGHPSNPLYK